jgi:dTDP-4-dehydrorhamnose 3,5-epimerase
MTAAPYGTYNLSSDGGPQSWADIAADVYELSGASREDVTGVSTEEYFRGKTAAPRPLNSVLDLAKIKATGFKPADSASRMLEYLR